MNQGKPISEAFMAKRVMKMNKSKEWSSSKQEPSPHPQEKRFTNAV